MSPTETDASDSHATKTLQARSSLDKLHCGHTTRADYTVGRGRDAPSTSVPPSYGINDLLPPVTLLMTGRTPRFTANLSVLISPMRLDAVKMVISVKLNTVSTTTGLCVRRIFLVFKSFSFYKANIYILWNT